MDLLNLTPTPTFMETPVKKSVSRDEIGEIITLLTDALEHLNGELDSLKSTTSARIDQIEDHLLNLTTDHEEFKKRQTTRNGENDLSLINENKLLKGKIHNLEKCLKEKETLIAALINVESQEEKNQDKWQTEKRKTPVSSISNFSLNTSNRYQQLNDQIEITQEQINATQPSNATRSSIRQFPRTLSNKRPDVVINHKQENDNPLWENRSKRTVPGNSTYKDTVKSGRRGLILGTSMVKGIRMREFNSYVRNGFMKLRPFPGATTKQLAYYAVPSLVDETPDRVIIHAGCNDIPNRNSSPEEIAKEIIKLAELSRAYGVNDVFVSALICRANTYLNDKVTRVNFLLNIICKEKGFIFIENKNIELGDLWKDGLHLLEIGKVKLANNFIQFLNNFY